MNRILILGIVWALGSTQIAVSQERQMTEETWKAAIQAQLDKEKPACIALFDQGHLTLKVGGGAMLTPREQAYYDHGIVVRQAAKVQSWGGTIIPMSSKRNAWRFDWAPGLLADVVNDQLCYGYHRKVDDVKPIQSSSSAGVEYTWHFEKVANWARREAWLATVDKEVWKAVTDGIEVGGMSDIFEARPSPNARR